VLQADGAVTGYRNRRPLVRGFAEGLALDIKWPTGPAANRANAVDFS
jgi:hypothetical protein